MCGIVGIFYKNPLKHCSHSMLTKMRDVMTHRGPDDHGIYIDNNFGFAHRRLSIIDLGTGHQPLTNEDKTLWIVFNGEIYNYKTLKSSLISKGHVFRTESDTEVILHLFEEYGQDCVSKLNGMFAFAIWDSNNKALFLARDRMGIKPLYFAETSKAFLFSSEIKAFFASDCISPACNEQAVTEYFIFRGVAGDRTLFKGVNALLPGHSMIFKDSSYKLKQYWTPYPSVINHDISFNQALEELSFLLQNSVKIRLMSDVPLGTFCSGGIDSSLVTAIAATQVNHPINTFSVGFNESDYDETNYARVVSKRYNTTHHEIKMTNREFTELLPKMIYHNDEPLHFSNSIHIFAISELAKNYVTVVLTGEGADELFGGYPRYLIPDILFKLKLFPNSIIKAMSFGNRFFKDHRIHKLLNFSSKSINNALLYNSSTSETSSILNLLLNDQDYKFLFRNHCLSNIEFIDSNIGKLSLIDQLTYLVSILYRQDKMSMAASIEARVPFLDYRLVEFANALPSSFKVRNTQRKYIIKKQAESFLPREIIQRKKSGFGVPLAKWLREENGLGGLLHHIICGKINDNIFNVNYINHLYYEHKTQSNDNSEILWTLINFLLWEKLFIS